MRAHRFDRAAGFTLLELMIVVVIIAILATVAIPAFTSYVMRAKAAEAPVFLGEIRQRQESYRAEFGRYATAPAGAPGPEGSGGAGWTPADVSGASNGIVYGFPTTDPDWNQLGAHPDGAVRFQYYTLSGDPGTVPPGDSGTGFTGNDFWFIADAQADLNGDGKYVTFEANSATNKIWCSSARGWD